jgi:hypothetical protein
MKGCGAVSFDRIHIDALLQQRTNARPVSFPDSVDQSQISTRSIKSGEKQQRDRKGSV